MEYTYRNNVKSWVTTLSTPKHFPTSLETSAFSGIFVLIIDYLPKIFSLFSSSTQNPTHPWSPALSELSVLTTHILFGSHFEPLPLLTNYLICVRFVPPFDEHWGGMIYISIHWCPAYWCGSYWCLYLLSYGLEKVVELVLFFLSLKYKIVIAHIEKVYNAFG